MSKTKAVRTATCLRTAKALITVTAVSTNKAGRAAKCLSGQRSVTKHGGKNRYMP